MNSQGNTRSGPGPGGVWGFPQAVSQQLEPPGTSCDFGHVGAVAEVVLVVEGRPVLVDDRQSMGWGALSLRSEAAQ